jgi:formylmethanofuran dehydrogenase subunit E
MDERDDEVRSIARCADCGELIYDDNRDAYVNDDGEYFCCLDCLLNYYSIRKIED